MNRGQADAWPLFYAVSVLVPAVRVAVTLQYAAAAHGPKATAHRPSLRLERIGDFNAAISSSSVSSQISSRDSAPRLCSWESLRPCRGRNADKPIGNNTPLLALYRLGYKGKMTRHGFRAVASSALNEAGFRPDVIGAAAGAERMRSARRTTGPSPMRMQ